VLRTPVDWTSSTTCVRHCNRIGATARRRAGTPLRYEARRAIFCRPQSISIVIVVVVEQGPLLPAAVPPAIQLAKVSVYDHACISIPCQQGGPVSVSSTLRRLSAATSQSGRLAAQPVDVRPGHALVGVTAQRTSRRRAPHGTAFRTEAASSLRPSLHIYIII
jgi:hypothetical protein